MKERFRHLRVAERVGRVVWYTAGCLQGPAREPCNVSNRLFHNRNHSARGGAHYSPVGSPSSVDRMSVTQIKQSGVYTWAGRRFKNISGWCMLGEMKCWDVQSWQPVPFTRTLTPEIICRLTCCAVSFLFAWLLTAGGTGKHRLISSGEEMCAAPRVALHSLGFNTCWVDRDLGSWAPQSLLNVVQVHRSSQVKLASEQLATLTGIASVSRSLLGNQLDSVAKGKGSTRKEYSRKKHSSYISVCV